MTTRFLDRMSTKRMPTGRTSLTVLLTVLGVAATSACGSDDKKDNTAAAVFAAQPGGPTANGLSMPPVQDWGVVGVAALSSNGGELRVVVGNDTAVTAARSGDTNPWPEGTALSDMVWKVKQNPVDAATIGPGDFKKVILMMKDSTKYAADGGWAYGVWDGPDLTPPTDPGFDRACVDCHTSSVKDQDYVFTKPGELPDLMAVNGAEDGVNGVAFPDKILDWRVIGVADIIGGASPNIRVVVGNPTAVTAARSGQTNPWPDGSRISDYVWAAGENPKIDKAVVPGNFTAFALMQRSSSNYSADNDWAFGRWGSMALTGLAANGDRVCVNCHTDKVSDRDMVFSEVAQFPEMMLPGASVAR
jgi:Cytochrome P460